MRPPVVLTLGLVATIIGSRPVGLASVLPTPSRDGVTVVLPCSASNLRLEAEWVGSMTHLYGNIIFTNRSTVRCALWGQPTVRIVDGLGHPLPVRDMPVVGSWEQRPLRGVSPDDWRRGVLRPGQRAFAALEWSNWCGRAVRAPLTPSIILPGTGQELRARTPVGTPECVVPSKPSVLQVSTIDLAPATGVLPLLVVDCPQSCP